MIRRYFLTIDRNAPVLFFAWGDFKYKLSEAAERRKV